MRETIILDQCQDGISFVVISYFKLVKLLEKESQRSKNEKKGSRMCA